MACREHAMWLALCKIGDDPADRWRTLFRKSALSDRAVPEKRFQEIFQETLMPHMVQRTNRKTSESRQG